MPRTPGGNRVPGAAAGSAGVAGVAASVLLVHLSLFLTLLIFTPIALAFTKPKPKKAGA